MSFMDEPSTENNQKDHYERIHATYAEHYYDEFSTEYRRQFFFDYLFNGLDLNGKQVGDLCCGDGVNSLAVRRQFPRAMLTGFDISPTAVKTFRNSLHSHAYEVDLTQPIPEVYIGQFDYLMCIGGLHHCVANLPQTVRNIEAMLKPGGLLLTVEPFSGSLLDLVRRRWYRHDPYFDEQNERAISPRELTTHALEVERLRYGGGPAYYLIFNSMIFRLSKSLKAALYRPLMVAEHIVQLLMPRFLAAVFLARIRKAD
jgi:SAM-dependent methyltransferase